MSGELRYGGTPRRLVDILNGLDDPFVVVHDAQMTGYARKGQAPRAFAVLQVHRSAVLLAAPRSEVTAHASPFETVAKVPVPATIVVPGFEVRGNIYLPPHADPAQAPLLLNARFIPLTDAVVSALRQPGVEWREPVLVVNLACVELWAPEAG